MGCINACQIIEDHCQRFNRVSSASADSDVVFVSACPNPQSSVYSLAFKSVISFSTIILLGLIIAYHCCEVQVEHLLAVT